MSDEEQFDPRPRPWIGILTGWEDIIFELEEEQEESPWANDASALVR